jgi:hypothetical protein
MDLMYLSFRPGEKGITSQCSMQDTFKGGDRERVSGNSYKRRFGDVVACQGSSPQGCGTRDPLSARWQSSFPRHMIMTIFCLNQVKRIFLIEETLSGHW